MELPVHLSQVLSKEPKLHGGILVTLDKVEKWLAPSTLTFFPEWTDHGPQHIRGVLNTAASLISDEAWDVLTPQDAATLVLATLFHDIAMFLNEDSLMSLICMKDDAQVISGDMPWNLMWDELRIQDRKYGGGCLANLFVGETFRDPREWSKEQREEIGNRFLRVHHGRLAHQIAVEGLPGVGDTPLVFAESITREMRDMAGLVARSHTLSTRDALPYLRSHYDNREYQGVHAVYLMTLLRVADYLQIQAERAPGEFLKSIRIRSRQSQAEWEAHGAIRDIRHSHEDPKAVFIHAKPESVYQFLHIQKWIKGIQSELDSSWELLDELYGRFGEFNRLTLMIRRVRSNLDDTAEFAKTVDYVPAEVGFRISDAEVLKRLVGPLYGNYPSIGVRELVQNAVDAVLELRALRPGYKFEPIDSVETDVLVTLETRDDGTGWLHVQDRGVGMSEQIIREYFLVAGRSYRESAVWKQSFHREDGTSTVLRSGRFGVGALAAFLLGDELIVVTKQMGMQEPIHFVARLDNRGVELKRMRSRVASSSGVRNQERTIDGTAIETCGTKISVRLSNREKDRLLDAARQLRLGYHESWDWYCLSDPSVTRQVVEGSASILKQTLELPCASASSKTLQVAGFRALPKAKIGSFAAVHWSYAWRYPHSSRGKRGDVTPALVCNGIRTVEHGRTVDDWILPFLSVFDPNGDLPLDLKREGLAAPLPFLDALVEALARDVIAALLVHLPETRNRKAVMHPSLAPPLYISTTRGACPFDPSLAYDAGIRHVLYLESRPGGLRESSERGIALGSVGYGGPRHRRGGFDDAASALRYWSSLPTSDPDTQLEIGGKKVRHSKRARGSMWETTGCPTKYFNFAKMRRPTEFYEYYLQQRPTGPLSSFGKVCTDVLGTDAMIPWSRVERRRKFRNAFDQLRAEIDFHESNGYW